MTTDRTLTHRIVVTNSASAMAGTVIGAFFLAEEAAQFADFVRSYPEPSLETGIFAAYVGLAALAARRKQWADCAAHLFAASFVLGLAAHAMPH